MFHPRQRKSLKGISGSVFHCAPRTSGKITIAHGWFEFIDDQGPRNSHDQPCCVRMLDSRTQVIVRLQVSIVRRRLKLNVRVEME